MVVKVGGWEVAPNTGIVTCTVEAPVGTTCCKGERVMSAADAMPDPALVTWPVISPGAAPEVLVATRVILLLPVSAVPTGTLSEIVAPYVVVGAVMAATTTS